MLEIPVVTIMFFGIIACIVIILLLWVFFQIGSKVGKLTAEKGFSYKITEARNDAVKRSRAVLSGQFSEQLAPYFPSFPAEPTEIRFIGKPVDYISFSGCSRDTIDEIVFIEVKTGRSSLSHIEKQVKKAIKEGRIKYVEYRIPPYQ